MIFHVPFAQHFHDQLNASDAVADGDVLCLCEEDPAMSHAGGACDHEEVYSMGEDNGFQLRGLGQMMFIGPAPIAELCCREHLYLSSPQALDDRRLDALIGVDPYASLDRTLEGYRFFSWVRLAWSSLYFLSSAVLCS